MSADAQALSAMLDNERQLLDALATLLEQEFELARAGSDPEPLLAEKETLVATLDRATRARLQWLAERNLPTHGSELRDAVSGMDPAGNLAELCAKLEAEAVACRDRNRQLAQFNLRRQRALQRALRLFTQPLDVENENYGARGQPAEQAAGRLLGSA